MLVVGGWLGGFFGGWFFGWGGVFGGGGLGGGFFGGGGGVGGVNPIPKAHGFNPQRPGASLTLCQETLRLPIITFPAETVESWK